MLFFLWECLETFFLFPVPMSCVFGFQHADRSNAKPCPGTTFRGGDLQVRIGKSWIQDSKYLDQGLIDVDCQAIFHSLRSGDTAGYSDQSCFVAFSVVSFVIPLIWDANGSSSRPLRLLLGWYHRSAGEMEWVWDLVTLSVDLNRIQECLLLNCLRLKAQLRCLYSSWGCQHWLHYNLTFWIWTWYVVRLVCLTFILSLLHKSIPLKALIFWSGSSTDLSERWVCRSSSTEHHPPFWS